MACKWDGCEAPVYSRGLCPRCYQRARAAGVVDKYAPVTHRLSDVDRASRRAVCCHCGPVEIMIRKSGRITCMTRYRAQRDRDDARRVRGPKDYRGGADVIIRRIRDMLHDLQNGLCAICDKPCHTGNALALDHDHGCCKYGCPRCIRGLLCQACNCGLGLLGDTEKALRKATAYLEGL